ncbi:SDR family oxidoreductase [Macrococcus sp. DPC7161]|uniref:SDR family oxidoreductase n=1 Tax=Macrococcus sp. DPC7161 TaxID=2507060 RepID=UPI00100A9988|nr:SDR family oxidoreductase [Macrococcus sp. DPC7161]RXK17451.1 SDR family oxidoreductase [Macrococcus sp. DPC7161]
MQRKTVLITGVSRRRGIGYSLAKRCLSLGMNVLIQHYVGHDERQPWGKDDISQVIKSLEQYKQDGAVFANQSVNFESDEAILSMESWMNEYGPIDYLVCNHAMSGHDGDIESLKPSWLDQHYQVNTKASMLLIQMFVRQFEPTRGLGKVLLFTSGQSLGPMSDEICYALSKGANSEITKSLAHHLAPKNITVNCINPGVTNTGYLDEPVQVQRLWIKDSFPFGRMSTPNDTANLVEFLLSDKGDWMTGQVFHSEGGFIR